MFSPGRFPLPVFAIPERFPLLILLHDDDEGRINFSVALSPKTTRTRNNKTHLCIASQKWDT